MNEEACGEESPEGNLLHGSLEDEQTKSNDALCKYYKLSYDLQTKSVIGFYWGAEMVERSSIKLVRPILRYLYPLL